MKEKKTKQVKRPKYLVVEFCGKNAYGYEAFDSLEEANERAAEFNASLKDTHVLSYSAFIRNLAIRYVSSYMQGQYTYGEFEGKNSSDFLNEFLGKHKPKCLVYNEDDKRYILAACDKYHAEWVKEQEAGRAKGQADNVLEAVSKTMSTIRESLDELCKILSDNK